MHNTCLKLLLHGFDLTHDTKVTSPPKQVPDAGMKKEINTSSPSSADNAGMAETPQRLGDLLIQHGLLTQEDLAKAVAAQEREQKLQKLPLGRILVEIGALSESELKDLLGHPDLKKNLGSIAVEKGLVQKEQLEACLAMREPQQPVGQALIEAGLLTSEDVKGLLQAQFNSPKLGELAVKQRLVSEKDLQNALRIQKSARLLGEILCDLNLISPMELNYVLNKYKKRLNLGSILLKKGYITEEQLTIALQEKTQSSAPLGEILVAKNFISHDQLLSSLSEQYNVPFDKLDGFAYEESIKTKLIKIINQKYSEKNLILPISLQGNKLIVGGFKPDHMHTVYDLQSMYSHLDISFTLIAHEKFEELFEILYSKRLSGSGPSDTTTSGSSQKDGIDFMELEIDEELGGKGGEAPLYGMRDIEVEELVNFILKYGIINGASDIHIEQDRKVTKLRYRIDGLLRETNIGWLKQKLSEKVSSVISRIKVMSNLDIAEKRIPQDGVFRINYFDKAEGEKFDLDFRVATCRGIVGENVTIRILDSRKANIGLDNLNHSPHVLGPFKTLLKSSGGMILVSGPTGSGKSSTLYAALQYLYSPGIKVITAEDPIEYSFPGIMQTQINPKIDLTFSRLLRSFLRLDPDVILVGEMRDEETAKIGCDAAQTGHLLLSTLHTNDAISSISRLLDLGVEYGQIASSLMGVLAQRLVRRICPNCKQEYIPDESEWGMLFEKYPSHLNFYKGIGCESCHFTGYKGRTLISEIFSVDNEIAQALMKGLNEDEIRKMAVESGMKTMLEDGLLKLEETTLPEIVRVVTHDMIKEYRTQKLAQNAADALIENLIGNGPEESKDKSPASFTVSNPERDSATLDLLQSEYENLLARNNVSAGEVDMSYFKEFISTNFHQICARYRCNSVTFNITSEAGKAQISAVPNL